MLRIENLSAGYGKESIIDRLSYTFEDGKKYAVTGPSGVGKTTLINVLSGLKKPTSGNIISDCDRVAYIFQEPRLFPWMTVLENVKTVCADEARARALLAALFDDDDVADKYPSELSGGMKQRVAIARALSYEPDLLLLDEPFRGLDEKTKERTAGVVWEQMAGKTAILITHDENDLALCHEQVILEAHGLRAEKLDNFSTE